MVEQLAGGRALPDEVLGQILAKAGGVPLYVEEVTKAVLASGQLADRGTRFELAGPLPSVAVPATLQDSLMAQLDRLAVVKQVTQVGAVIGREFSHELLAMLLPMPDPELRKALDQLVKADLIHRSGDADRETYAFKHVLVRDAAYESLLRSRRRQIHEQIARLLEERFPDVARSEPELLAHHGTAAGRDEMAIAWWQRAGEQAARRWANAEAIGHFRRALELLARLPETPERDRREMILQASLGVPLIAARGYSAPEVGLAYGRARELCRGMEDAPSLFPILFGLCIFYFVVTKLPAARDLAAQCLVVAEHAGDEDLLIEACGLVGSCTLYLGELTEARASLERGLALYRPERHAAHALVYGQDPVATMAFVARCHALLGHPDRARRRAAAFQAMTRNLSTNPNTLGALHNQLAAFHLILREGGAAREHAEAAIALAREHDLPLWLGLGRMYRGAALIAQGQASGDQHLTAEGLEEGSAGMAAYRATGAGLDVVAGLAWLAAGEARLGRPAAGLRRLDEALALIALSQERYLEAEVHRLRGELTLALPGPDPAAAEACFRAGLDVARRQRAKLLELRAAASLARLWRSQGRIGEARDLLAPLCAWFADGRDILDLREAEALR
jgi:predicted ATPase